MPQDIEQDIIRFMREETSRGRFDFTIREIAGGVMASYPKVDKAMIGLSSKGVVDYRTRSSTERPTRYYYLETLKELVEQAYGEDVHPGKSARSNRDSGRTPVEKKGQVDEGDN